MVVGVSPSVASTLSPHGFEAQLAAAKAGDQDALVAVVLARQQYLMLLARHWLPARARAKLGYSDLVQETFARAIADFPDFRGESSAQFDVWIREILRHRMLNCLRALRTRGRDLGRERPIDADGRGAELADPVTPSWKLQMRESQDELRAALGRLTEREREVIRLSFEEHLPYAEIADQLGLPSADAARKVLERAKSKLRKWVGEPEWGR